MDQAPPSRFDATIHPGKSAREEELASLDLDRLPDRYGRIRALVSAQQCARLLDMGYQVRLRRHHPVRPLDPALIETDESVRQWIDERLAEIRRDGPGQGKPTRDGR